MDRTRCTHPVRLVVVLLAIWCVVPSSAAGQAPPVSTTVVQVAAQAWSPPLTPFGHPDLQGVWVNRRATPFQRPEALQGRQSLTDAEVAELEERANRLFWSGSSDITLGDGLFRTALDNPDSFISPNGSNRSSAYMVPRVFDARTSLIIDPPDGRIPELTPGARRRQMEVRVKATGFPGPESFHSRTRCITQGVPRMGPGPEGDPLYAYHQIFQAPDYVVVMLEAFHDARIIPLDGRPPLSSGVRQWHGNSRGRWDGQTLVIDSQNFSPQSNFLGATSGLRVVERLTRVSSDTIEYEVTLDDPTTWTTTPWTVLIYLTLTTDRIFEYACHEGNADSMTTMLRIARMEEKATEGAGSRD